eukprot:5564457-Pyramimonas_sp.AAC.1
MYCLALIAPSRGAGALRYFVDPAVWPAHPPAAVLPQAGHGIARCATRSAPLDTTATHGASVALGAPPWALGPAGNGRPG